MNKSTVDRRQKTEYSPAISVLHLRSSVFFAFTVVLFLAIGAFSPAAIGAESLSGPAIPDGFGVNIHFTGLPRDLHMIAEAGFKFIRMDLAWSRIERTKGVYDFKESGYDSLTLGCEKLGIRVLYILDYSNKLYESDRSVRTEAGRKAFADFAEAAAKRYAGKGILWEIWNEANIKQFWSPQPSVDDYCKLVEASASRIRNADPSGQVVAGATSQIPLGWFEGCFKNGLLNWIDVLSVHPYRSQPPETVIQDYAKLRGLIARYAPTGKQIPVISGEWGYSNLNWDKSRLTEQQQADYLVRMFLVNSYQNIPVSIWYDWKNDGTDPKEREHQFGTVGHDLNPKAAYLAAKVLSSTLEGYSISEKLDLGNENDFAFMLTNGNSKAVAFWTLGPRHNVNLPIDPTEVTLIGIYGGKVIINWKTEHLNIRAEQSPQYLLIEPQDN
ncbi:MAG TPA: cellulase family glycosylhydrolase [Sedimentisphaerales bacterium]|nr:cellulase family glycosylhydrolase [Sedimentisphaerales bacterium]